MWVGWSVKEGVCFRAYILKEFQIYFVGCFVMDMWWYYLPTPPLGQDMTQGQFLSGV